MHKLTFSTFLSLAVVVASMGVTPRVAGAAPLAVPPKAITITGDTTIDRDSYFHLKIENLPPRSAVFWDFMSNGNLVRKKEATKTNLRFSGPPATYKLQIRIITIPSDPNAELGTQEISQELTVKGDPVPPGPTPPGPTPPGPTPPTPGVAPIKGDGIRVLIIEDAKKRAVLPKEQLNALFAKSTRDWLRANTAKDADNPDGAWRQWDVTDDTSNETQSWQDAFKRERKSVPWVIISNGTKGTGYEGVVPGSAEEFLNLLKKYQ